MAQSSRTPKKMWFRPAPNPRNPWDGGAVLHVLTWDDERHEYGLDLKRLLSLQTVVAQVVQIVVTHTVPAPSEDDTGSGITEEEIASIAKLLDDPNVMKQFDTNEKEEGTDD